MTSKAVSEVVKPVEGPESCHCHAARRSARHLTRIYDQHLAACGLSISQFSILAMVHAHPDISISALAELMVMERTTLLRALKPLRADELLICEPRGSKSALELRLTTAGQVKISTAEPFWKAAQKTFEEQVGTDKAIHLRNNTLEILFAK